MDSNKINSPSSGSNDSDDAVDGTVKEIHLKEECRYKKMQISMGGKTLYVLIRLCSCGKYKDRKYLLDAEIDTKRIDGKEFHGVSECGWKKGMPLKEDGKIVGYPLVRRCNGCIVPEHVGAVTSMNCKY